MKEKSTLLLSISVLAFVFAISLLSGCQETGKVSDDGIPKGPFFYPPLPDIPRIQFLKSFSGSETADAEVSAFENFIVGEEEVEESAIGKPFGFALYDNRIYICDMQIAGVMILDLVTGEYRPLKRDRRMVQPSNICIDNGNKYISDQSARAIFVYGKDDDLLAIWGRERGLSPIDIGIYGEYLYVLDGSSSQVVVLDKTNGKEIKRLGTRGKEKGQLEYVTGLAIDEDGNLYISDKINGYITKLNSEGVYQQTISYRGLSIGGLTRPKGLDVDKEGRVWVVDSATNVAKIFNKEGQLLLYLGKGGTFPGDMYLPASIRIDYDHIDAFQKYAVPDAQFECLIIISNQYGPNKISVYGLGTFPNEEARALKMQEKTITRDKNVDKGVISSDKTDQTESD